LAPPLAKPVACDAVMLVLILLKDPGPPGAELNPPLSEGTVSGAERGCNRGIGEFLPTVLTLT
jgi:hypothetical protein